MAILPSNHGPKLASQPILFYALPNYSFLAPSRIFAVESSRRSVIIGLSTKQSPGGTTPTEDAPTEIKLPPLVPFKPKPAAAADSGAASTTKVEVVIPPVHREDSSPPEVEKTASSPEAAKPAGENPAVQNGLLLAWSDATVKPA